MSVRRKPRVWSKYERDVPRDAVDIMRPTKWGNPYVIGADGMTRQDVIARYIMQVGSDWKFLMMVRRELAGKDLVCCCAPRACHGDFLLKIANMRDGLYRVETEKFCAGFVLKDGIIVEQSPITHRILRRRPGAWLFASERVSS